MPEAKTIPAKYIFLDIDGFTHNRSAEAQSHIVKVLNDIVETSISEFGLPKEQILFVPSSDGICIALLNVESPYDIHLLIALKIVSEVHKYSAATENEMRKFQIRVGLNSHIDNLITDINGHQNIAGAGVNVASRLMNLADGNQILVSDPIFEALRYHEKYLSSFKSFRVKLKHNQVLPVHQFTAKGHIGLSIAIPSSLQATEKAVTTQMQQTLLPLAKTQEVKPASRVGAVEFVKKPTDKQLADTWAGQTKSADGETTQPSVLKGILPPPELPKAEAKSEFVKSKAVKTEPLPFLEHVEEPKQSRPFIWAALILLLVGGSLGAWVWVRAPQQTAETTTSPLSTTTTLNATTTVPPTTSTTTASTTAPSSSPTTSVVETASATKPNTAFEPKTETSEPKVKNNVEPVRPSAPQRTYSPRLVVQRTVAQRPEPKPQPIRQAAKVENPKASKRVTLDDLINEK